MFVLLGLLVASREANDRDVEKVGERLQDIPPAAQEEVKRLPGGKVKKKEKQEVIIEKVVRNKRKCITTVKGLELFGIKLSDASKKLGKNGVYNGYLAQCAGSCHLLHRGRHEATIGLWW
ncbi:hypothetical protein MLD38_015140 [Melastoma candidum]|uniref:Uncharacterized protein n=1 Tax=Melastoma candidum TaxID=119954 RepID=A0ACB9RF15_9MYRT|nr:hypothetical protein MLD38_015140 [Melastoma candidum]